MKSTTRRKFIQRGIKLGLVSPLITPHIISCTAEDRQSTTVEKETKKLKILILGGTSFLGPHQVAYAISRGHSVTTFTRGKTQPTIYQDLFEQVEPLVGDREDNLTALEQGEWDLVIDNSGRKVQWTEDTANLLKDRAKLYLYTSSTGVYYPYLGDDITEEQEVLLELPTGPDYEENDFIYDYGVMKASSELAAVNAFGADRTIVVRPTYMFGPADRTNRLVYWPVRLAKGGEVLVPGKSEDRVQYIDVRDVAEWMIRLAEDQITGTFNAVGPRSQTTMMEFVQQASQAFDTESTFVAIDDYAFLKENELMYLVPWIMPEGNNYGSARINNQKAQVNGLTYRDLPQSMRDTYNWWYSEAVDKERRDKFENEENSMFLREAGIIERWRAR